MTKLSEVASAGDWTMHTRSKEEIAEMIDGVDGALEIMHSPPPYMSIEELAANNIEALTGALAIFIACRQDLQKYFEP
jgi:hypothetical protein